MQKTFLCFAFVSAQWLCASITKAETAEETLSYVEANVVMILYHEIGHALIDTLDLPVLGQEEDAADLLSVVMMNRLWLESFARAAADGAALSYRFSAEDDESEPPYWGVHGLDQQRFYNIVCLFYGADSEGRADFAARHELPEARAETCEEEFALAEASWGGYLDKIAVEDGEPPAASFSFEDLSDGENDIATLLANEVDDLNARFRMPVTIPIRLEPCNEANAYYWPETQSITICTEFITYLREQAAAHDL